MIQDTLCMASTVYLSNNKPNSTRKISRGHEQASQDVRKHQNTPCGTTCPSYISIKIAHRVERLRFYSLGPVIRGCTRGPF